MKQIAIIGSGPAGIEAAKTAAALGAQVTMISISPVGGRAGWHSLVPSKVWLASADAIGLASSISELGLAGSQAIKPDYPKILQRIQQVSSHWNRQQATELAEAGVEILSGQAVFENPGLLAVSGDNGEIHHLSADAVIIATGSVPHFPDGLQPDGKQVIAPRHANHLEELPEDIVVIGAGATSSEFAHLFNRIGVRVTWIVDPKGVLPGFTPAAGQALRDALVNRGVRVVEGHFATRIERHTTGVRVELDNGEQVTASLAFVGVGRRPDTASLQLERAGLVLKPGEAIPVDPFGRIEVTGLYAVGDVTGAPMLANKAVSQARVAARHATGSPTSPYRPETLIHAVYTEPQVAQVGFLAKPDGQIAYIDQPYQAGLKSHLVQASSGFIRLTYSLEGLRVLGALAVGPHAADILAPIALTIQYGGSLIDLAESSPAYPTASELAALTARSLPA